MKYKYVLFDLDGTVSRSAEGIRTSLEYAIRRLHVPVPDLDDFTLYIGPPLIDTSKYEPFAEEIIHILDLTDYFDAVCGSNLDGSRKDKWDLIPYAVDSLGGSFDRDRERTVMIGDTRFDAHGAAKIGVDFIGVQYGYGTTEGMQREGATVFAETPADLLPLLTKAE